jgi:hypothetical protein
MFDRAPDIAACLGLDEAQIRQLQARGYLLSLELNQAQIRLRLYHSHRRYLRQRERIGAGMMLEELFAPCLLLSEVQSLFDHEVRGSC